MRLNTLKYKLANEYKKYKRNDGVQKWSFRTVNFFTMIDNFSYASCFTEKIIISRYERTHVHNIIKYNFKEHYEYDYFTV